MNSVEQQGALPQVDDDVVGRPLLSKEDEHFMLIDQRSVEQGSWHALAKKVAAEEERQLIQSLGDTAKKFNTVGYCRKLQVQILSPFSVPLGPLRRKWFDEFLEVSECF